MEKIPNIVQQRLAAQQSAGEHPDADLLTAFAEQRLSSAERDGVFGHLSGCSACREIVASASNATADFAPPAITETAIETRAWWSIPAFQWGAAAAALAMVAVGLLMLQPRQKSEQVASNATYKVPTAQSADRSDKAAKSTQQDKTTLNESASVAAPAPDRRARVLRPGEAPSFTDKAKQVPGSSAADSARFNSLKQYGALAKDSSKDDRELERSEVRGRQVSGGLTAEAKSQSVQVSGSSAPVQTGGGIGAGAGAGIGGNQGGVNATGESVAVTASSAQASPAAPAPGKSTGMRVIANESTAAESRGAAASTTATSSASVASAAPQTASQPSSADADKQARALTPARAADELATGQAGPAVAAVRGKIAMSAKPAAAIWRITNGRLQHFDSSRAAWDDINVGSTARLSMVTPLGSEVWVGGSDGAMFYSNDQGAHWIPTSTGGWSSDATITGMTATARRSVEVYFSNGERWRSADGGASWTRYQ